MVLQQGSMSSSPTTTVLTNINLLTSVLSHAVVGDILFSLVKTVLATLQPRPCRWCRNTAFLPSSHVGDLATSPSHHLLTPLVTRYDLQVTATWRIRSEKDNTGDNAGGRERGVWERRVVRAVFFFLSKVVISITHIERERKWDVVEEKRDRERCKRNYWKEMQIFDARDIGHWKHMLRQTNIASKCHQFFTYFWNSKWHRFRREVF